jgi:hypothetical protein
MIGICQSVGQLEAVLGERLTKDTLTAWRNAFILRTKDSELIRLLQDLGGKYWQRVHSSGVSTSSQGPSRSENEGYQQVDRYYPSDIAQGHPRLPDAGLFIDSNAKTRWLVNIPYFRGEPWTRLWINCIEKIIHKPTKLPLPDLARNGDYSKLSPDLRPRFQAIQHRHSQY